MAFGGELNSSEAALTGLKTADTCRKPRFFKDYFLVEECRSKTNEI